MRPSSEDCAAKRAMQVRSCARPMYNRDETQPDMVEAVRAGDVRCMYVEQMMIILRARASHTLSKKKKGGLGRAL